MSKLSADLSAVVAVGLDLAKHIFQVHCIDVRLMPPAYVKPYVRRQKNDAADAEAICDAVTR